ncbi:sugar 3,4-ketoisomerase [Vibrio crassostreae]|uniref:Sugar 3,4-ketoisomerase QdtA cupin domain-containing protein n=1 Tax=Vibrio crassostreae TaxID=246167 RepID=A0ABM9QNF5_9VIBR|nr:FdtA/QdtA family cupin domain-containing protein [Vibrio crassostreae]TCL27600.1 dTDP-4-dehydrorhamnose 3,5-epimerase-like enzyme [Vibrio crassostreae]TCT48975.1 dTDP-4-dehydrorhamnose 3,5-epimerase-like enzyme [Vibrio crassostreae]TCT58601.1 dTDP-4-dehydrorhamnose 3,5-epimerase-like enzyme [Vibrio crassostreae]CAK1706064.1 TDP-4-oxo-6-deoxy-alpha-D-glucose-3, 4-oxoisomerase [Vibrio crassostreae]CAK1707910.1 TDP-4-oxo-6-deoxy-alpha-D-glucose-3, 4-oxoisomerase [Vibrio crassostreae]
MDVKFIQFQAHGDERGSLVSLEDKKNIPFAIERVYYLYNTKGDVRRGFHAHKKLKQLAVVLKGSCRFLLDDGKERIDFLLDNPEQGLFIESFVWREMYDFSDDCVLLVLADSFYDEADYIRDYDQFLKEIQS